MTRTVEIVKMQLIFVERPCGGSNVKNDRCLTQERQIEKKWDRGSIYERLCTSTIHCSLWSSW